MVISIFHLKLLVLYFTGILILFATKEEKGKKYYF
jgi:hypothetical protein